MAQGSQQGLWGEQASISPGQRRTTTGATGGAARAGRAWAGFAVTGLGLYSPTHIPAAGYLEALHVVVMAVH